MAMMCGPCVTAVVTEGGALFTWGANTFGQLGLGTLVHQQQPARIDGLDQPAAARVRMVAAGSFHQVVVLEDGSICTWGCGGFCQLWDGDHQPKRVVGGCGGGAFARRVRLDPASTTDTARVLRSMQKKVPARLGLDVFAGSPVVMVSCGMTHTLAVTAAGRAWTCGNNKFGQLGHGDTADRTSFTLVSLERLEEAMIVMAACNSFHNAVVTAEGRVWTWGHGKAGCLGHNDEQTRLAPVLVAGEQFDGSTIVMVAAGLGHTVAVMMMMIVYWYSFSNHYTRECIHWTRVGRRGCGAGENMASWAWATTFEG